MWAVAAAYAPLLRNFRWRREVDFNVDTLQPVVMTYCTGATFTEGTGTDLSFGFANLSSEIHYPDAPTITLTDEKLISQAQKFMADDTVPGIFWIDDQGLRDVTGSTVNVVTKIPVGIWDEPSYYTCSVGSRYGDANIQTQRYTARFVTGGPPYFSASDDLRKVYPSAEWLDRLNPVLPEWNSSGTVTTTPFGEMARAAGIWNTTQYASQYNCPSIMETILAAMLADGMSRAAYNASLVGTLRNDWESRILPQAALGYGRPMYDVSASEQETASDYEIKVTIEGYAYSYRGATQIAAICILLIYFLLACCHTVYAGWTGWCSRSWDTAPEITALALTSDAVGTTSNTGAGIHTMETIEQGIQIREKNERLQIVPTHNFRVQPNIIPGIKYG